MADLLDIDNLTFERQRVADEFRARLAHLNTLRAQLVDAATDDARLRFYAAVDEETTSCRGLGDKLRQIDSRIEALFDVDTAAGRASE